MLRTALAIAGYDVEEAADGAAALHRIHNNPPDALVLDLGLPTVSGYIVHQEVAAHAHTRHIPVVIITGSDDQLDHLKVPCVLRKPINPETLVMTVRQCFKSAAGAV